MLRHKEILSCRQSLLNLRRYRNLSVPIEKQWDVSAQHAIIPYMIILNHSAFKELAADVLITKETFKQITFIV